MEKWRKKWNLALMSVALFAIAPIGVQAGNCDPCDFDGFDVGVDFLWWQPTVGDLAYCAEDPSNDSGSGHKIKNFCPDWEPGVRVYIRTTDLFCGWDFGASYTYVDSCDSSSTKNSEKIKPTYTHAGFFFTESNGTTYYDEGKGSWDSEYHEWDVVTSFDNSCNECYQLSHTFGVAGIVVDEEFKATIEKPGKKIRTVEDSDYWGVGFRLGTNFEKRLSDCLSFFASGNATVLAGEACVKNKFDSQDADTDAEHTYKEDDFCQLVPGYHIAAGFSYETCACDWEFSLRLGYEFLAWHNLPSRRTYIADNFGNDLGNTPVQPNDGFLATVSTPASTRTFGFHGLFVGAQLSF